MERVREVQLLQNKGYNTLGQAELESREWNTVRIGCIPALVEVSTYEPGLACFASEGAGEQRVEVHL